MIAGYHGLNWLGWNVLSNPFPYPSLELAQLLFHPEIDWQVVEEL